MSIDLAALREAAEAATPGPWVVPASEDEYVGPWDVVTDGTPGERYVICEHAGIDAAFIAAANPAAVLELLDRLEAAEAEAAHLQEWSE